VIPFHQNTPSSEQYFRSANRRLLFRRNVNRRLWLWRHLNSKPDHPLLRQPPISLHCCRFLGFNFPGACLLSSILTVRGGVGWGTSWQWYQGKGYFLSHHDIIHLFNSSALNLTSQSPHRLFFSFISSLSLWCSFPKLFSQISRSYFVFGR
jgi:hypothetical protein